METYRERIQKELQKSSILSADLLEYFLGFFAELLEETQKRLVEIFESGVEEEMRWFDSCAGGLLRALRAKNETLVNTYRNEFLSHVSASSHAVEDALKTDEVRAQIKRIGI